jgi:hypothetical protein
MKVNVCCFSRGCSFHTFSFRRESSAMHTLCVSKGSVTKNRCQRLETTRPR